MAAGGSATVKRVGMRHFRSGGCGAVREDHDRAMCEHRLVCCVLSVGQGDQVRPVRCRDTCDRSSPDSLRGVVR
jgi:hypothetical protein